MRNLYLRLKEAIRLSILALFVFAASYSSYVYGVVSHYPIDVPMTFHLTEHSCKEPREVASADSAGKDKLQPSHLRESCALLGSKNGTKFYTRDCSGLSRIKEENLRCFHSEEEAEKLGYTKSKTCL